MTAQGTLTARGIRVGYGGRHVLAGIDLELPPGSALGVLGRSGAGKTTLVQVLSGRMRPEFGQVTLDGHTVSKPGRRDKKIVRARVRSVSQNGQGTIDPLHTVDRVMRSALDEARRAGRSTGADAAEVLATVQAPAHLLPRRFGTLSGGEKQRVAIAAAVATRPDVLLLDEPLTAVDPGERDRVAATIAAIAAEHGTTLFLASHDLHLLERLTDEVVVLADGKIVERGPLARLLDDPAHPATREVAEAVPQLLAARPQSRP